MVAKAISATRMANDSRMGSPPGMSVMWRRSRQPSDDRAPDSVTRLTISQHQNCSRPPIKGYNVHFRSKADMCNAQAHVCFGPKADIELIIQSLDWRELKQECRFDLTVMTTTSK